MKQPEKILCAAIWYQDKELNPENNSLPKNLDYGLCIAGRRHHNCIGVFYLLTKKTTGANTVQGFLTTHDRFVNRITALEIALREGQIRNVDEIRGNELYSEDLY